MKFKDTISKYLKESKGVDIAGNNLATKYRKEIEKLIEEIEKDEKKYVNQIRDEDNKSWGKINQFRKFKSKVRDLFPVLDKIISTKSS